MTFRLMFQKEGKSSIPLNHNTKLARLKRQRKMISSSKTLKGNKPKNNNKFRTINDNLLAL